MEEKGAWKRGVAIPKGMREWVVMSTEWVHLIYSWEGFTFLMALPLQILSAIVRMLKLRLHNILGGSRAT